MHNQNECKVFSAVECQNQFCTKATQTLFPATFAEQQIYFCAECIKLYENRQFCYFCAQVYQENQSEFLDGKTWLGCDGQSCNRWMHLDCEKNNGLGEIETYIQNDKYKYYCPWCRRKKQKPKRTKKFEKRDQKIKKVIESCQSDQTRTKNRLDYEVFKIQSVTKPPQFETFYSTFNDLLLKYGGPNQHVSTEEVQRDLSLLKSFDK